MADAVVDGRALCLSGGGYRAMLFHVGTCWRLHELGWLTTLNRVSSVSGGSIAAGALALAWPALSQDVAPNTQKFVRAFVEPVREIARQTIDVRAFLRGVLTTSSIAQCVADAYDRWLFHGATLQDLPDDSDGRAPRFVINASNVQTGTLFRFSRPYIADWRLGQIANPTLPLAIAVAASSAFPPVLSPMRLEFSHSDWTPTAGADLDHAPFTTHPVLTDGGVYDNMGLESVWKQFRTLLVSDAGATLPAQTRPRRNPVQHVLRVLNIIDNQVRDLRLRDVMQALQLPRNDNALWRAGAYWGISTDISRYQVASALPCPHEAALRLAAIPTRLAAIDDVTQERVINWGYAVCDAAMQRYVLESSAVAPAVFPYPARGVG